MRRKPAILFAGLTLGALALAGCSSTSGDSTTSETATEAQTASDSTGTYSELSYDDLGIKEAAAVDGSKAVAVTLADGASTAVAGVSVEGDTVTITAAGTYHLSGTLTAGSVVVDVESGQVNLILDGVSITSGDTAAINVVSADAVVVELAEGSTNTLSDAGTTAASTDEDAPNAVLFSTADLYIEGSGSLTVTATINDGIASKDSLIIGGGTISVDSADDGVRGKDHIVVREGTLTINAGGDGIKADNDEVTTDSSSTKGVAWIEGGTVNITAADEGIQAAHQLTVAGGTISVAAQGHGLESDGVLRVSDGSITVSESYEAMQAAVMLLSGGTGDLTSSDDGINVAGGYAEAATTTEDANGDQQGAAAGDATAPTSGTMPGGGTRPDAGTMPGDGTRPERGQGGQGGGTGDAAGGGMGGGMGGDTVATDPSELTVSTASGGESGAMPGASGDSSRYLEISGGTWIVDGGGDGVDVNGTFTMSGGTLVVAGPSSNNNSAIDTDSAYTVTGGTIAAAGSSGMLVTPDSAESEGTVVAVFSGGVAAGTAITIADSSGAVVASFTTERVSQALVYSAPEIVAGDEYTITVGATVTGDATGWLTAGGTATGGTQVGAVTAS